MSWLVSLVSFGLVAQTAAAQDVAITNARVVVGNGTVFNSGTIVVRGGKIVSVTAGSAKASAERSLRTIDAKGMTAMPGFIDAHRHINTGPNEKPQMQALLEAGYTTILSGGGPADGNITLRDHIEKGVINGRGIPSEGSLREIRLRWRFLKSQARGNGREVHGEIAPRRCLGQAIGNSVLRVVVRGGPACSSGPLVVHRRSSRASTPA
jgi:hypothetical protein